MRQSEKGFALLLVLALLALGSLLIIPALGLAFTMLKSKQINTGFLKEQYARDGGAEYAMWQVLYGGIASLLTYPGQETFSTITLNGQPVQVSVKMQASLSEPGVPGAENNRIRPSKTVVCAKDADGVFDDDCSTLPGGSGMKAQYTVSLKQVIPDISVPLVAIYDELPKGFTQPVGGWSVTTPDGSFPQILSVSPVDIQSGGDFILKWDFSAAPIYFSWGEVKKFTFTANINSQRNRYCNKVLLKMQQTPPYEQSDKTAPILVDNPTQQGCEGGGTKVAKYVDKQVAPAGQTTIFTYVINVENVDQNVLHIANIKDVLPQGGFTFCNASSTPPCDPPKYKMSANRFDPQAAGAFTTVTGYTDLDNPAQTYLAANNRWQLVWDGPGGAGWNITAAGATEDNFNLRFQAKVVPAGSGSYYNEAFVDISTGCTAPVVLRNEGVTTNAEYCASYSWPSGGVVVPSYDVRSLTQSTLGQGNFAVDWGASPADGELKSWYVK